MSWVDLYYGGFLATWLTELVIDHHTPVPLALMRAMVWPQTVCMWCIDAAFDYDPPSR